MPGQGQGPLEGEAALWTSGVVRPPLGTWQAVWLPERLRAWHEVCALYDAAVCRALTVL